MESDKIETPSNIVDYKIDYKKEFMELDKIETLNVMRKFKVQITYDTNFSKTLDLLIMTPSSKEEIIKYVLKKEIINNEAFMLDHPSKLSLEIEVL